MNIACSLTKNTKSQACIATMNGAALYPMHPRVQVGHRKFVTLLLEAVFLSTEPRQGFLTQFGADFAHFGVFSALPRCRESKKNFLLPT